MSNLVDQNEINMMIEETASDIDSIPIPADNDSEVRVVLENQMAQLRK